MLVWTSVENNSKEMKEDEAGKKLCLMEFKARKIHVHLQQNRSSCGAENKSTTNVKKKLKKNQKLTHCGTPILPLLSI